MKAHKSSMSSDIAEKKIKYYTSDDDPKKKMKQKRKKKPISSDSSSTTSSSSDSSDSYKEKRKRKLKKAIKKKKKQMKAERKEQKKKKSKKNIKSKTERKEIIQQEPKVYGPEIPVDIIQQAKKMAPMTKEEWEKQQSKVTRVFDPETGRNRLIKGSGEVLEEIVSRERHKEINKQATLGDGQYFQSSVNKLH